MARKSTRSTTTETPCSTRRDSTSHDPSVAVLGKIFPDQAALRLHFTDALRAWLKDPDFRSREGFPIGSDENILRLSDPPYYTACPNPWIGEWIAEWGQQRPAGIEDENYRREPFAHDVKEGKGDPIYAAHAYHTKVPHKAIMRYILHYTEPGDIVMDGFCGTGMTGVAATLCGDRDEVLSLGYQIDSDGTLRKKVQTENNGYQWLPFSRLGQRRSLLSDLSPAASFISYNYNSPGTGIDRWSEIHAILSAIEQEIGWMYETKHHDGSVGRINYVIWSDVFLCNHCHSEFVFWDASVDAETHNMKKAMQCTTCKRQLEKNKIQHVWQSVFDEILKGPIPRVKQVPVLINYKASGKRHFKKPDPYDHELLERIAAEPIASPYPSDRIPHGDKTREVFGNGFTHVHHLFTKRNLSVLARLWSALADHPRGKLAVTSILMKTASLFHNIGMKNGKINLAGALPNAMYIPSNVAERNLFELLRGKLKDFEKAGLVTQKYSQVVSVSSLSDPAYGKSLAHSIDYLFFDPPFGANLQYSELSFLWEAWLGIRTNQTQEAVQNKSQNKSLDDYRLLMQACFTQAYTALKPGRWMTVEFSNTNAAVWNSIQSAIINAGFVVGSVNLLSKGQGTFNSQTNSTSVHQDLVISAYKPIQGFDGRSGHASQEDEGVWQFTRNHLEQLPMTKLHDDPAAFLRDRDPRILFDQMVVHYLRKGLQVPISSPDFRRGLKDRFIERNGMFFLPEQALQYDRNKITHRA